MKISALSDLSHPKQAQLSREPKRYIRGTLGVGWKKGTSDLITSLVAASTTDALRVRIHDSVRGLLKLKYNSRWHLLIF